MTAGPYDTQWRRTAAWAALIVAMLPLNACAEVEVGIEAAKRINRALAPQTGVQLAQATTTNRQNDATEQTLVSPYLDPAPEIFEATGLALWDGKRTLQGIWVAHPLATTARRVRIFNEGNGQAVDGALFKRDTAQGGPSVLISSEAAQMLGMTPGESAELRIVAVTPVRRDQPKPGAVAQAPLDETATPVQNETLAGQTSSAEAPQAEEPSQPAASTEESQAAPQLAAQEDPVETVEQPASETAQSTAPSETVLAAAPTPAPRPAVTPDPSGAGENLTFQWDSANEPAEDSAARDPKPIEQATATPEPAQPAAPAKPEPAQTAAPASTLKLPFIQAGVFGVASNATNLVARLKKKGIPALTRKAGSKLTRVLAGPFQSEADRSAALLAIRKLGLRDAVPVKR